ncbi:MAG TPA: ATP-dependent DNA helicase, partial [Nevskiaceae bacterium]|nr:ATP-dependent DNA helicase [Nevskiaceae bacterium]
ADDDPLLRQVTSTSDNCLGSKCPDFSSCFVAKARRAAQAADVVVINHHLLFADYLLKEEGFGQILSGVDVCIIDEAHQLPELAAAFFGVRLSTRQLHELCKDTETEAGKLADIAHVGECVAELGRRAATLESGFAQMPNRITLHEFLNNGRVSEAVQAARDALQALYESIKPYEERSAEMASCVARAAALVERLQTILDEQDHERVRWVEALGRGGSLHATPILVAEGFRRMAATYPGAWIFTSATLAASEDFSHFSGQLGLDQARELKLDSPFDFSTQARLYLPKGMPDPSDPAYSDAVADAALPLIQASGGGAFVLCTSHRALRRIAERLRPKLKQKLYVQGDDSRAALLQAFAADGDGVLIGTSSFWEGVDVKGRALRLVIIDKLPFTAPGDPVFEAKLAAIRAGGGNPFNDFQVPQAITALRQGVGRLIRDAADRGLLALCDPRLRSKMYGRRMLASLPQMPVLSELADAQQWLRSL